MVAEALRLKRASDDRLAALAPHDPAAAEALCARYREPLARYCHALLRDREDAADATQAAMERALRALQQERVPHDLRPWLYRIAHNEAIGLVRRRRPTAPATALEQLEAPAVDHVTRERLRELLGDLGGLPERQRGALLLRELAGLGYEEIGETFGTSPQAARQVVFAARSSLAATAAAREAPCDSVRRTLSDADGRSMRARSLRAHLRACDGCRDFARGIRTRRRDLALLPPALPLAAGAAAVGGLAWGSTLVGGWNVTKGVATLAAAVTAGAGSIATVEKLTQETHRDARASATRLATPQPAPPPRAAAIRADALASATAPPVSLDAVREAVRRPASGAVLRTRRAGTAFATARTELSTTRAAPARRERAVAEAPATAPATTPPASATPSAPKPTAPLVQRRPGTPVDVTATQEAVKQTVQQVQTQVQQATQETVQRMTTQVQQVVSQVEEQVRTSTQTLLSQLLGGAPK